MIDRQSLVTRHNPIYTKPVKDAPLSVGNGRFCFTADFTGLQTFFDDYAAPADGFPLCTMAEWGWHSCADAPKDDSLLRLTPFDTQGRPVGYAVDDAGQEELFKALRQNAHKFHLGKIGFELESKSLTQENCRSGKQTLNLWEGLLSSAFTIDGEPVLTETFVHPHEDTLYVRVASPLLAAGKLRVTVSFPYGSHKKSAADFMLPHLHTTTLIEKTASQNITLERVMDGVTYRVIANVTGLSCDVVPGPLPAHTLAFSGTGDTAELAIRFAPLCIPAISITAMDIDNAGSNGMDSNTVLPYPSPFTEARAACTAFWKNYWTSGGAIDLSGSADSRAEELERRIVLSQYLIAIQSRGTLPPAETGLTCNSWYGKFHLEMHYWHSLQFALWDRPEELKKSLGWYKKILPVARKIAASQGYNGARWPKMCDPTGYNTPSSVAVLLIWQQSHPVMLAEFYYRASPSEAFLREYRDIIVESAEFMQSFVHWISPDRCVLDAPYIPAQERHDPRVVLNAAYELEYFRWGLKQADEWLARLGEDHRFSGTAEKLTLPAHKDGVYLAHENCPDTFTALPFYTDHPSMLAMWGILDSDKIDQAMMSATLDKVLAVWDMKTLYGWDFPMMAMTACRLGRYDNAIDLLLLDSPKNTYMPNGHNRMVGDDALPLYLPGNGGLLIAAAMIAAGFGGKTGSSFPKGFTVQTEGLHAYL
ncbi:hypothetical protein AGMMS50267_05280 [Spirochaetia bacterium]|nr:hypothetical protein AGMMS50267_05280 [Spirochaetia bacterium]